MAAWTYLVADLRTNTIMGELPLSDVRMTKTLNGSGQLRASFNLGDPKVQVHNPHELTIPAITVIYAVRDNTPWWGGIIWATEYDDETSKLSIGCADFWSYFDHRKVLEILPAAPLSTTYVAGLSTVYTQIEQNQIARNLVNLAQSHTGGNIGIVVDSASSGILRDRTYFGYDLNYTGQTLRDLANITDGPDMVFDVAGPDSSGKPIRLMRTGTPRLGQAGTAHRWDLGGNLLSYVWTCGGGVMATRTFAQGEGFDRATKIAVAEDTTLLADRWPLLETDDIHASVVLDATLQGHADGRLAQSRLPRTGVKLSIRGDMKPSFGEYAVGDDARMVIPAGNLFFTAGVDLPVRILSIEVDIDDQGQETIRVPCQTLSAVL